MQFAFFGSGTFALPVVNALDAAGLRPALIVSQPPRRRRRRGEEEPTPVHRRALEWGVPILAPPRVNEPEALDELRAAALGWVTGNYDAMELEGSTIEGLRGGYIWWRETYSTRIRIRQSI